MKKNNRIYNLDNTITRFSIRKYQGFGAASVAVAAFFMMTNTHFAKADVSDSKETNDQIQTQSNLNQTNDLTKESTPITKVNNVNNEQKNPEPVTTQNSVDKSKLNQLVAQYKAIDLSPKTEESIKAFEADVNEAERVLNSNLTQQEVNRFYYKFLNSAGKLRNKTTMDSNDLTNNDNQRTQNKETIHTPPRTRINTNSQPKHLPHGSYFRAVDTAANTVASTDPLSKNETDASIKNGNFRQVSGGNLPTRSNKLTIVRGVDHWHSLSKDPNPEYPILFTPAAKDYANFMSDNTDPYGVVLARTTNGWDRSVLDPRVAGIYQDIDVTPGSELVINFISTSPTFTDGVTGAKLKISNVEGTQTLFDKRLDAMQNFPTGWLKAMVNIPDNMNQVRISFLPISINNALTTRESNSGHGFGDNPNYNYGGTVSRVTANTGAYVVSRINQVNYDAVASTPTSNVARATVSLTVENKGHTQSKETTYKVVLPPNSKFISATGANGNYNANTNTLTLNISNIHGGNTKDISYTVEFEAMRPKLVDLNGQISYKTNAPFRGDGSQKTGNNSVNTQTVTLKMNKTDLESKLTEVEAHIRDLKESNYTNQSWNALKEKIAEARTIINEDNNNVALDNRASQATINTVTNELVTLKGELKMATPSKPIVNANNQEANVTISPALEADKVNISYHNTNNENDTLVATKSNATWSLDKQVQGITINENTGKITISYSAVQSESLITATETTGNSADSELSEITMPRKETTPGAPTIKADQTNATVTVIPVGESTKIVIKYKNKENQAGEIIATKTGSTWSLNKQETGITIDANSGDVTISYSAVHPESEVTASETKGNSDMSPESKVNMPRKEQTPVPPIVNANEAQANVNIAPNGESTKVVVQYINNGGQASTVTATKEGTTWSLDKDVSGISINSNSGQVTISHLAVQPESEVTASETKGNSDASQEIKVKMPRKESTPQAPTISTNEEQASVIVTPSDDSTKMVIKYLDLEDQINSITASKINHQWSLNKQVQGITIEPNTGKVEISYQATQPESDIIATETKGNSDESGESKTVMPRKEDIPEPPTVSANVEQANVNVVPNDDSTKVIVNYTNTEGQIISINANKEGTAWRLDKQEEGITINENTGELTISYTAAQPESEVTASEIKGNSDASALSKVKMPRKESTPEAPTVNTDDVETNVSILPNDESTKLEINFKNKEGQSSKITATKEGGIWNLDKEVPGITIEPTTGEVTISYTAVQPESEVIASETKGNSEASEVSKVAMPRKESTPSAPTVKADVSLANVSILPNNESTKVIVQFINKDGKLETAITTKEGAIWSIDKEVPGITLDTTTGEVIISHTAVQAESEVTASETKGNSDSSGLNKVTMPRKESTPDAPTVNANEAQANVSILPNGESTKLEINFTNKEGQTTTVIATKEEQNWILDKEVPGITLDTNTGEVSISYTAVQPESEITASETKGNSEASQTSKVTMPRKEQTPPAPTIIADVERASVSVIPNDESTKVVIKYLDLEDQISTITASKINHQWSLNKVVPGITIEPNSGKVEISYQATQPESDIIATEIKGNSDESGEGKTVMPRKESTPEPPTVSANEMQASVSIVPAVESDKLKVHYTNKDGQASILIATKEGSTWTLDKQESGITLDTNTGEVTISYSAVQPESEITASETKANNDESEVSKVTMPRKESTPEAPTVNANEAQANVSILPNDDSTKLEIHYTNKDGQASAIIVTKEGTSWILDTEVPGISINPNTGEITISYTAVQPESEVTASETKGNSDASESSKVTMPRKEATPEPPIVSANDKEATVTVKPNDGATKVEIQIIDKKGKAIQITVNKKEALWSINENINGISLDSITGKVTISSETVEAGSVISTVEYRGNSDRSKVINIKMPQKLINKEKNKTNTSKVKTKAHISEKGKEKSKTKSKPKTNKALPDTGETNETNRTLISSILLIGLILIRKSRKKKDTI
ncbi:SasC/FmtB family protein [Staphylococcus caprae]|uniref:SasC/FmtB family protein n=1 Tax=Staphylococcus caprae TaxID=29380 RepID=UPI001BD17472|nr:SasC/FmtB family protein [Staphylococcus caprae]